jgi:hypothetical protein
MASYKVPQDVEADDKLIGPFSFRQFIYLIIVAAAIAIGYFLSRLFIGLAIIPLPVILFFGALALPLRKDQPMETYLAAIVSFYLKPHRRLWDPDGQQSLIEIVAAKNSSDQPQLKNISQGEADRRFSYLANIVDSQGWAVRGVDQAPNSAMNTDVFYEAQQAEDILDESTRTSHMIDSQLDHAAAKHKQELLARMQQPIASQPQATPQMQQQVQAVADPYQNLNPQPQATQAQQPVADPQVVFNPYPNSIQQKVIQPIGATQPQTQPQIQPQQPVSETPSEKRVSPDIISLANNPDLSVETIAHEANRIKEREGSLKDDEVVISLH